MAKLGFSEEIEKFNEYCGNILRLGTSVESDLELFISHYYGSNEKQLQLHYDVIVKLNFETKIRILSKILEEEQIDKGTAENLINAIRRIQNARNSVAHNEGLINDPTKNIVLHKKSIIIKKEDMIDVNAKLVEEIEQKKQEYHKIRWEIDKILSDPNRKKEPRLIF